MAKRVGNTLRIAHFQALTPMSGEAPDADIEVTRVGYPHAQFICLDAVLCHARLYRINGICQNGSLVQF